MPPGFQFSNGTIVARRRVVHFVTKVLTKEDTAMQTKIFMNLTSVITAVITLTICAPVHAGMVTTSRRVPLAGTVFVSLSNGSLDGVALSGAAHVVTQVAQPDNPMRINVNLDQVAGVGDLTGFRYVGAGMNRINLPTIPGDPINLGFDLLAVELPP